LRPYKKRLGLERAQRVFKGRNSKAQEKKAWNEDGEKEFFRKGSPEREKGS